MTEKTYEVAHLDELDRLPVDDEGLVWRPVRRRLGIQAFGTNAYTAAKAGDRVVEEHYERGGHEELYFVFQGRATFTLEEEEVHAPAGTVVFCRPGTKRGAVAAEPETTVLAFGAKPGVPHEISKWEATFAAMGYLRVGDEARGRQEMEAAVAAYPDEWQGHYNAACFEALTGNRAAAIAYLRRAVELSPEAAEAARTDKDFDAIREDPEFPA
jgi:quercetin dioxygenase-like cupin family protein